VDQGFALPLLDKEFSTLAVAVVEQGMEAVKAVLVVLEAVVRLVADPVYRALLALQILVGEVVVVLET
jgi:hypothetical protein